MAIARRLRDVFVQTREIQKALHVWCCHEVLRGAREHVMVRAPGRWWMGSRNINLVYRFLSRNNGTEMLPKYKVLQGYVDQDGALWFSSSRALPWMQPQGLRHLSSATKVEQTGARRELLESPESDSSYTPAERIGEEYLDDYMKSRYDRKSIQRTEDESENKDPLLGEALKEDLVRKLKPNSEGRFENIVTILGDPRVLAAAHERLNVRRRNWTLASNVLEVSHVFKENKLLRSREIDWNWFKEAAHQLRTGSYPFKPVKRVEIARRGRSEPRHWIFVRPQDQVVQEAIRDILEKIYEPVFSVDAHESRAGSSIHSALNSIKHRWKGISWFLQFDVRILDHTLVQNRLLRILAERIQDDLFFDAVQQMFKLGTIWVDTFTDESKAEGSVLSPMLANIYFHQLDLEITRIKGEIDVKPSENAPTKSSQESEHAKRNGKI